MVIDLRKKAPAFRPVFLLRMKKKNTSNCSPERSSPAADRSRAAAPVVSVPHMHCECNQSDEEFVAWCVRCKKRFAPEKFSRWCISPFLTTLPVTAGGLLRAEKSNPSPYMFFMQDNDFTLFGGRRRARSSMTPPAARLRSTRCRNTSTRSSCRWFAGQRPRHRIELEMRTDHKELSEHLMLGISPVMTWRVFALPVVATSPSYKS